LAVGRGDEGSAFLDGRFGWGTAERKLFSAKQEVSFSDMMNVLVGRSVGQEDVMLQERILLHELNHRINNEFAAAIGLVSLAAARSGNDEVKTVLSGVARRLHQYADVHRALQMPEHDTLIDATGYLQQLCRSICRSQLDGRKIHLVLAAEPLLLPADRCWCLGMIVFELINNAARHAFADGEGEIRVELLSAERFFECRVTDNGSASADVRPGRGCKIMNALSQSLGGRLEQTLGPRGSSSILLFPATGNCNR
jgi:two-component sensor histidine kinase